MPVSMCKVLYIFLANANYKNIVASVTLQKETAETAVWRDCSDVYKIYQTLITDRLIATGRNRQIARWIRDEFPEVAHKFGSRLFVKNIKAKLRPLSQGENCRIISDWIKAIGSHLFWWHQLWWWCWNTSSDVEISAIPYYKWAWVCYAFSQVF